MHVTHSRHGRLQTAITHSRIGFWETDKCEIPNVFFFHSRIKIVSHPGEVIWRFSNISCTYFLLVEMFRCSSKLLLQSEKRRMGGIKYILQADLTSHLTWIGSLGVQHKGEALGSNGHDSYNPSCPQNGSLSLASLVKWSWSSWGWMKGQHGKCNTECVWDLRLCWRKEFHSVTREREQWIQKEQRVKHACWV